MTTIEQALHEPCPSWCDNRGDDCDGNHWSQSGYVSASLNPGAGVVHVDQLGVAAHFDREWHYKGRPENRMDQEPHVYLHAFSSNGEIDSDARMTAGEARRLAQLLLDAAALLDGSGVG